MVAKAAELDRIEAKALAAGAVRWDRSQIVRHMRWLVMRVCRRMSPARIADAERVPRTDRAIAGAVRAAGELIGLPLPPLRRGRPPKRRPARVVRRR